MVKLAQEDHSYRLSWDEFQRYQKLRYLTFKQVGQNCTALTSIRLPSCSHNQEPSPPRIRRRTCRTYSFSAISKMAPFFLKRFLVELGHVQKLVELMSSIHFFQLFVSVGFVYSWWRSAVSDGVCQLYTSYDTFSHAVNTHCLSHITLHGSRMCWCASSHLHGHPRCAVVRSLTLCSSSCSCPCVSPILSSSTWTLSWTSSSMWPSSGQYPTGTPSTEESGSLAENIPPTWPVRSESDQRRIQSSQVKSACWQCGGQPENNWLDTFSMTRAKCVSGRRTREKWRMVLSKSMHRLPRDNLSGAWGLELFFTKIQCSPSRVESKIPVAKLAISFLWWSSFALLNRGSAAIGTSAEFWHLSASDSASWKRLGSNWKYEGCWRTCRTREHGREVLGTRSAVGCWYAEHLPLAVGVAFVLWIVASRLYMCGAPTANVSCYNAGSKWGVILFRLLFAARLRKLSPSPDRLSHTVIHIPIGVLRILYGGGVLVKMWASCSRCDKQLGGLKRAPK